MLINIFFNKKHYHFINKYVKIYKDVIFACVMVKQFKLWLKYYKEAIMKTIGIIGAMEEEIENIKPHINIISTKNIVGLDFFMGKMGGNNVVLVRSGIGKVNAAVCSQVLIDLYAVDYIINVGVAGAVSPELNVGDVVISKDTVQHDMDTSAFGDPLGEIPRMAESYFKADDELVKLALECAEEICTPEKVFFGRVASGDQFISDKEKKKKLWTTFGAYCTEMEGAAIAHACWLNKIPFVIIRSISDNADNEADMKYEEFVEIAAKNSGEIVYKLLQSI